MKRSAALSGVIALLGESENGAKELSVARDLRRPIDEKLARLPATRK